VTNDAILSILGRTPVNLLLHSTLAVHARERGEKELPGAFFVEAISALGHEKQAVRQALFRSEKDGEFLSRKALRGRGRLYRLSPYLEAAVAAGTEKIFGHDESEWDGEFTIVQYAFEDARRVDRDGMRDLLEVEGFAPLARGLHVHPRDRSARVLEAVSRADARRHVTIFRGRRLGSETDAEFVARLWDLRDVARRYRAFLSVFASWNEKRAERESGERAFAARLAVAIAFLEVAWDDPGLPKAFLPAEWPGPLARKTARSIYERLLPGALAHGDAVLERVRSGARPKTHKTEKTKKAKAS
jgi:phenylacetic acid degradation operon negative regulatory protein